MNEFVFIPVTAMLNRMDGGARLHRRDLPAGGGIGIFSVMQISISERVYEIGLRKSIGATDGAIFGQFLIESVSLSLVGGLLGAALGYGITMLASQAFEDGLAVSPTGLLLAAAFAVVIVLSAGVWPAVKAAPLAPVDALRAL